MGNSKRSSGSVSLDEYYSTTAKLLSDTALFLSHNTKIYSRYEQDLKNLRITLDENRENRDKIGFIRQKVAEIRKSLRLQGYNLKLGSFDLKVDGFRNEEAASQGFKRCVILLTDDGDVLYMAGTNNHIEMEKALRARLSASGRQSAAGVHHLWFNWINRVLVLSGAASESAENLESLEDYADRYKDHLLKKLMRIG